MAADGKETQAQLDLQLQINKVLADRQIILAAQQKALSSQVQMAVDMCKALKCEELDKVEENLKRTRDALTAAEIEAKRLSTSLGNAGAAGAKAGRDTTNAAKDLGGALDKSSLTLAGFGAGVLQFGGIFIQTFKNVLSMAGGFLTSLGQIGMAIISIPFKLLDGLFNLAQSSGGGGPSPIKLALEKIRGELGGLNTALGKAAKSSLPQFRKQLKDLGGTGLSVRKVFGAGAEGLAKAMEFNLELIKAMGPAAANFTNVLEKNAPVLAAYRKGLGLSAEGEAKIMTQAANMGQDPVKAMDRLASMSIQMAKQFGLSASDISKDFAEMKADVANFGTLSERELIQTSVYARKLGVAIKDLQGLFGAFDDFETAAQNAAKLSQSLNMNVDAMKMLNAENPAERLSLLQKAFRETGKSVEGLKRQELKLLAAQSGISEETAKIAFSQRGLSMSYEDVQKAGAKAEKKQLTQAEAMEKLADAIERVFGSGGGNKFEGFFDAFSKGFQRGIFRSKEVRGLFRDIRQSLTAMYRAAIPLGKMFVDMFPGISTMIAGLRDLFNPQKWKIMIGRITEIFTTFFQDLQTDPKAGTEKFIENMKNLFKDFFGQKGSAIDTIMEGGKAFLKALGGIFSAVGPILLELFVDAINAIADFLEKPPQIPGAVTRLGNQLLDGLIRIFNVLAERLWPPLKRMLSALWAKVGPYIEDTLWAIFYVSLAKAFLKGVVGALGGAAVTVLTQYLLKLFKLAETTAPPPGTAKPPDPARLASMGPGLLKFMAIVGVLLLAFWAVVHIYKSYKLTVQDAIGISALLVTLAGAGVALAFALKLMPDAQGLYAKAGSLAGLFAGMLTAVTIFAGFYKLINLSAEQAATMSLVLIATTAAGVGLAYALQLMPQAKGLGVKAIVLAALFGAMLVPLTIFAGFYKLINLSAEQAATMSLVLIATAAAGVGLAFALSLAPDDDWKKSAKKAVGIGLVMLAMGAAGAAVMSMISTMAVPSIGAVTAWAAIMLVLILTSIPMLGAAMLAGQFPQGEVVKGMLVVGAFMVAMGVIGGAIAVILSMAVPNAQAVGILMAGISALMLSTAALIPVATGLGLLLAGPQAVLLAATAAGMPVLAGFASQLVNTLMPVITQLAAIRIANPEHFKAVTEALLNIMNAINAFVEGLANLGAVLKPSEAVMSADPQAFQKNISAFSGIVNAILNSGINQLVQKLMDFASGEDMAEGAADAVAAIGSVLGAVSALIGAFAPDGSILQSMAQNSGSPTDAMMLMAGGPGAVAYVASAITRAYTQAKMMDALAEYQKIAGKNMSDNLPKIFAGVKGLFEAVKGMPPEMKDVAPVISALASVLTAVAALLNAMKPSDATMAAVTEAMDTTGEDGVEALDKAFKGTAAISNKLSGLLTGIKRPIADLVGTIFSVMKPIMESAQGLSKDVLVAVTGALTSVTDFVKGMMETFKVMMDQAAAAASNNPKESFYAVLMNLGTEFRYLANSLAIMIEPIGTLISHIISIARTIPAEDAASLKSKVDVIDSSLKIISLMGTVMSNVKGHWRGEGETRTWISGAQSMKEFIWSFVDKTAPAYELFKPEGLMQQFVNMLSLITVPKGVDGKAAAISKVVEAVSSVGTAFSASGGLRNLANSTDLTTTVTKLYTSITALLTTPVGAPAGTRGTIFDSINRLITAVPAIADKSADIGRMFTQVNQLITGIKGLGNTAALDQVINLGNALSSTEEIKVDVGNVNITMKICVNVDAKMIAEAILESNNKPGQVRGPNNQRFATQNAI